MASEKITGSSIFGSDVGQYFEKFINYTDRAKKEIDELRASIVLLNSAMKGKRGLAELQNAVNQNMWQYARILKVTNKLEDNHVANLMQTKAAMQAVNKQGKRHNTMLRSMGGSLRSLLGAAGFGGLAYTLFQTGRSIFNYTKKLDSLNLALDKITDSTYQFAESKRFLSKMSNRLGLDILKTAKSYTTFRAAAKQSNLTLGETNEIFESFADVGANLALTSSEMGSIFLALEQMLSKGKVSTEELRRQLGEKLPGAMGIMAEALGVSTGELDKMLRKGEVLTEDALPKFAAKVREVYGVDMTQSVTTLQAAQNRLTNAWTEFVALLNEDGGVGDIFINVLDTLTLIVEQAEILADILGEKGPGSWQNVMTQAFTETWDTVKMIGDGIIRFSALLADFWSFGMFDILEGYDKFTSDEITLPGGEISTETKERQRAIDQRKAQRERQQATIELQRVTRILNLEMDEEIVKQLELWELDKLTTDQIKEKIDFIEKQTLSVMKQRKALNDADKDAKKRYEEEYKRRKELGTLPTKQTALDPVAQVESRYRRMEKALVDHLNKIRKDAEELKRLLLVFPDDIEAQTELRKIEKEINAYRQRLLSGVEVDVSGDALARYAKNAGYTPPAGKPKTGEEQPTLGGVDLAGDGEDTWEKRLQFAKAGFEKLFEWENTLFALKQEQLRMEDEALTEKYDRLFRLAEGDADHQERLRIRKEQDEERIEKKRKKLAHDKAKAERRQALIDIAINTAIAVSRVWAQTGVFALAAQWPVLAMGAAQAAIVVATPLPEYAEGTDNHPGGPAIVGDGGKEELVFTPDGKAYMTLDRPQVMDMPKGSQVISDARDYIQKETLKAIIESDRRMDDLVVDKVAKAVQRGFKGVGVDARSNVQVNIGHQLWRQKLLN